MRVVKIAMMKIKVMVMREGKLINDGNIIGLTIIEATTSSVVNAFRTGKKVDGITMMTRVGGRKSKSASDLSSHAIHVISSD